MKQLDAIYEHDFRAVTEPTSRSDYFYRRAARAVLIDAAGKVFLMYVGLHGYHKLPGGGIQKGEDVKAALARELMEEMGCEAEILSEVGEIVEYRDFEKMVQTSYCYVARQIGDKVINSLEEDELAEQMTELKAGSIDEAIRLAEADTPDTIEGLFIQRRDVAFLREAQHLL